MTTTRPSTRRTPAMAVTGLAGPAVLGFLLVLRIADAPSHLGAWLGLAAAVAWLARTLFAGGDDDAGHRGVAGWLALGTMLVAGSVASPSTDVLGFVPAIVALFAVVGWPAAPPRHGVVAAAVCLLALATGLLASPDAGPGAAVGSLMAYGMVLLGAVGRRQFRASEAADRSMLEARVAAEAERAQVAVLEERARLARDLHDVLAHSLGALVVQLDAVDAELEAGQPGPARDRARRARRLAADGLEDARRAVGALRDPDATTESVVRALLDTHRGLGGTASATFGGTASTRPESVETIRRATQELLTNARRHAPGQDVGIDLNGADAVTLVVSTPRTHRATNSIGGGRGLAGLRERVAGIGGDVAVDPGDPFMVTVRVPA